MSDTEIDVYEPVILESAAAVLRSVSSLYTSRRQSASVLAVRLVALLDLDQDRKDLVDRRIQVALGVVATAPGEYFDWYGFENDPKTTKEMILAKVAEAAEKALVPII